MSKIKEKLQRDQEREMSEYAAFMEWVCNQRLEVSVNSKNEEEESSKEPSTVGTSILPLNTLKPANNRYYEPKQGA